MNEPEVDKYFAEMMKDLKFKEAINSLLGFYEMDSFRAFKTSKNTEDLVHAQGAANMVETLRNYFTVRIATEALIDDQRMDE